MGIPGMRGGDHIGITVPDMAQAHEFLIEVLGCEFVYALPQMRHDDDWMRTHLNVDPRRVIKEIRLYRCGFGLNFEVFAYEPHDGQRDQPRNSDIGGHHVALYVDDMDAAVEYLASRGVRLLEGPVSSRNASAGQRWQYFLSPWGMQFELVSYPGGKAYEKGAPGGRPGRVGRENTVLLWHPARPGELSVAADGAGVASARIADSLREAILDGSYLPGERIRQEDLAAQSGASRIPVREALRVLHSEGLVTLVANSGAWVTKLTLGECAETYRIRERLEPLLLRASMPELDAAAFDRLAALAQEMERSQGVDAFLRADRDFHLASYAGAAGSQAWQIIHRMWNTTQHYRREFTRLAARSGMKPGPRPGLEITHLEHRLLLDSIRRGDGDDAERVLVTHIRRTRLELEKHPEIFH